MWDLVDDFNSCSSCVHEFNFYTNGWGLGLQYYDKNNYGAIWTNFSSYWVSLQYMANVRSSRMMWWQQYHSWSEIVSAEYVSYPLVWFVDNGAWGITFKYFVNSDTPYFEDFNVSSRAWFTHTFWDWTSCLMDQVFFNAWSIIFKCSDSNRTYQILAGWYTLWNHILYVDAYNSTNNLWFIEWFEWKAWSITLSKEDLSEILYWDVEINQSLLESLFLTWYDSYTVSPGWSNIWPTCWLMACTTQSRDTSSVWFVYTKDLTPVVPDFWGWSNVDSNSWTWVILSWSISQQKTLEEYNSCIDRYINVKDLSSFWFQCRSDYENNKLTRSQYLDIENYVLDLSSNTAFTWETVTDNCFLMSDIALNMFDTHSWTYNVDVNLAWRWSSSTNWVDLTYMCWSRPSQSSSSDWVSWWQDLLNQIWIWNSEEWSWSSVLDITIDSFKNLVSSPINEYVIDPISEEYYSWYNLLSNSACITTNNSFPYGDYLLYFAAAILSVVLFGIFF